MLNVGSLQSQSLSKVTLATSNARGRKIVNEHCQWGVRFVLATLLALSSAPLTQQSSMAADMSAQASDVSAQASDKSAEAADKNAEAAQAQMSAAQPVKVGSRAPDFSLQADNGQTVELSDYLGKSNVVIFFYAKDDLPICTRESCAFRNSYSKFKVKDAEVLGISSDSLESHAHFKSEEELPYLLLSDPNAEVRNQWGCPSFRVTYVIDKKGIVRHIFDAPWEDQKHVDEALKGLNEITSAN